MHKKAQGVSITVVIVAAIALIVLVVLAAIFIGRAGTFRKAVAECESLGNSRCFSIDEGCQEPYSTPRPDVACYTGGELNEEEICCLRLT